MWRVAFSSVRIISSVWCRLASRKEVEHPFPTPRTPQACLHKIHVVTMGTPCNVFQAPKPPTKATHQSVGQESTQIFNQPPDRQEMSEPTTEEKNNQPPENHSPKTASQVRSQLRKPARYIAWPKNSPLPSTHFLRLLERYCLQGGQEPVHETQKHEYARVKFVLSLSAEQN